MRPHAPRHLRAAPVAAILALIACSPEPTARTSDLYDEYFDGSCDGLPCGWTQVSGAPGAAHTTATLLPGLRGLALIGDGVIVDGPPGTTSTSGSFLGGLGGGLEAVLVARCDAAALLTVRVAVVSATTPDGSTAHTGAGLFEARLVPAEGWGTSGSAGDETRQALLPIVTPPESAPVLRIESVLIQKNGPGQCEIDSLTIEQSTYGAIDGYYGCI